MLRFTCHMTMSLNGFRFSWNIRLLWWWWFKYYVQKYCIKQFFSLLTKSSLNYCVFLTMRHQRMLCVFDCKKLKCFISQYSGCNWALLQRKFYCTCIKRAPLQNDTFTRPLVHLNTDLSYFLIKTLRIVCDGFCYRRMRYYYYY